MNDKASSLGLPSYVWREGQERRFQLLRQHVALENAHILDAGCGVGLFVRRFRDFTDRVLGIELDAERAATAAATLPDICQGSVEALPYPNRCFDLVFSHEVLEHVDDDRKALKEAWRVLKPGGALALFLPNRWYPFETHGFYWFGHYRFGNIPLINYLPRAARDRMCPHVRAYTRKEVERLIKGLEHYRIVAYRGIFAGYDNIAAKSPRLARYLRGLSYRLEGSPLQRLALSHFYVIRKYI